MPRVWLLLLVGILGCASSERGSVPAEAPITSEVPMAESLAGTAGETNIAGRNHGEHPRRIIYTANVDVVVEDFEGVPGRVADLAEQFGGYVAGSNVHGQPGHPRRGTWTIRVPVEQYEGLLSEARQLLPPEFSAACRLVFVEHT